MQQSWREDETSASERAHHDAWHACQRAQCTSMRVHSHGGQS